MNSESTKHVARLYFRIVHVNEVLKQNHLVTAMQFVRVDLVRMPVHVLVIDELFEVKGYTQGKNGINVNLGSVQKETISEFKGLVRELRRIGWTVVDGFAERSGLAR